jgi:hypothetical protein
MTIIDRDLHSCEKCDKPFEPRSGSGGSAQRFCCTGCRLSFHKQRLRSERRGAHAGSIAPSGTQQPPQNETPTSEPTITALRPCETGLDARTVNATSVAAPSYDPIQSCVTILHHCGCDTARQRTRPGAAYSAPRGLAATGEPPQNEMLLSRPAGPARPPWETETLDIADCGRAEFVIALNEGESAGTRVETWPSQVRALIDQHANSWVKENKDRLTVRAMTVAAPKYDGIQSCVVILHHSPKYDGRADSSKRRVPDGALPGPRGFS